MNIGGVEIKTDGMDTCPCGIETLRGYKFESHCWRVGKCCPYSGVHIIKYPTGKLKEARRIAKMIADYIGEGFCTEVKVTTKKLK